MLMDGGDAATEVIEPPNKTVVGRVNAGVNDIHPSRLGSLSFYRPTDRYRFGHPQCLDRSRCLFRSRHDLPDAAQSLGRC